MSKKRWTYGIFLGLLLIIFILTIWLKLVHGGGVSYPRIATPAQTNKLETFIELDFPPGNVAVAGNGRVFVNYHPFARADRFGPTMFEVKDGHLEPWPNSKASWQGVFGMTVDKQDRLWLIEPAGLDHSRTRLSAWDLQTNQLVFEYWFEEGTLRFAQDLRVTADGETVILADTGLFKFTPPSISVFSPRTKRLIHRLSDDSSTSPQDWTIHTQIGEHKLGYGLVNFAVGVDGIEISADQSWLYFAAMSHQNLYRVPIKALSDLRFSDNAIAGLVENLGNKPLSDGITIDSQNRVVITDIEHGGLMIRDTKGNLSTLVSSPLVRWADGVVQAPNGDLLFTDSAIPSYIDQLARPPELSKILEHRPYRIFRIPSAALKQ